MIQLAQIFQNGMILQRGCPVAVWGTGEAGEKLTLEIQGRTAETCVKEDGSWTAQLPPLDASREETLNIRGQKSDGQTEEIAIADVAVGEVWIAGGQSNMEFPMCYEKHWEEE